MHGYLTNLRNNFMPDFHAATKYCVGMFKYAKRDVQYTPSDVGVLLSSGQNSPSSAILLRRTDSLASRTLTGFQTAAPKRYFNGVHASEAGKHILPVREIAPRIKNGWHCPNRAC